MGESRGSDGGREGSGVSNAPKEGRSDGKRLLIVDSALMTLHVPIRMGHQTLK